MPFMDVNQIYILYKQFLEDSNNKEMGLVLNYIEDPQLKELFDYCK